MQIESLGNLHMLKLDSYSLKYSRAGKVVLWNNPLCQLLESLIVEMGLDRRTAERVLSPKDVGLTGFLCI